MADDLTLRVVSLEIVRGEKPLGLVHMAEETAVFAERMAPDIFLELAPQLRKFGAKTAQHRAPRSLIWLRVAL